jgi:tetratricopeptide (TPR) repeat protein
VIALALSLFLAAPPAVAGEGSVLASYSFDDDDGVVTGPDTFAIWQGAWHTGTGRGHARLSSAYHVSGFRSVELHDIAGDKDFPELQGYFQVRRTGRLYFHFGFLTTDPKEELNIALAGPRYFVVQKDGIAFWLGTRKGLLVHHSDSMFKKLVAVEAFVWYTVDVAYDLDSGTYDLSVRREGDKAPLFTLQGQPNASRQPGSAVDKFSFVGAPFSDASNVTYYVDDVVIGTDRQETLKPFVAPGRRKLFLDLFTHYQLLLQEKPRCLPVGAPADLGFGDDDMAALRNDGLLFALQKLLDRDSVDVGAFLKETTARNPALRAMADWNDGCAALEKDEPERALPAFVRAETARPNAPIYTLSAVLALARLKRFAEADERLLRLSAVWRDDARYEVASAYVGVARGDLVRAEEWLRTPADRVLDRDASPLVRLLRSGAATLDLVDALKRELADEFQARVEETFVAEQYFYVLLWQSRFDLARGYAQRMVDRLVRAEIPASVWYERAGDAAFYGKDLEVAREMYAQAEKGDPPVSVFLKEADLAYLAGDLARERQLREHYYGRLAEE